MQLTIFGATGGVGQQAVTQALDAGHKVTAVVRDPARLPVTDTAGLTVTTIRDLSEPEPLVDAIAGSDAVISCVGPPGRRADGVATTVTRAIIGALATAGVTRFVAVSAQPVGGPPEGESLLGRLLVYPIVGFVFRDVYRDLGQMEADIRRSGAEWTIVRPGRLIDAPTPDERRTVVGGNVPNARSVSRAAVAAVMLAAVEDRDTVRQVVGVTG
jgi:uncharacterized protein YbjT (DUF2867 family)